MWRFTDLKSQLQREIFSHLIFISGGSEKNSITIALKIWLKMSLNEMKVFFLSQKPLKQINFRSTVVVVVVFAPFLIRKFD